MELARIVHLSLSEIFQLYNRGDFPDDFKHLTLNTLFELHHNSEDDASEDVFEDAVER